MIERGALKDVVESLLTDSDRTVASGGAVRLANGCTFCKGLPDMVKLPRN